jgi:heme exporter protein CcmD
MDWNAEYAGFVAACYALSFACIAGLAICIMARDRRAAKALALFEKARP